MEKILTIQKNWNALNSDISRWIYLIFHKTELGIILDNDTTRAVYHSSVIPDNCDDLDLLPDLNEFDEWLGAHEGTFTLLEVLDIEVDGA